MAKNKLTILGIYNKDASDLETFQSYLQVKVEWDDNDRVFHYELTDCVITHDESGINCTKDVTKIDDNENYFEGLLYEYAKECYVAIFLNAVSLMKAHLNYEIIKLIDYTRE